LFVGDGEKNKFPLFVRRFFATMDGCEKNSTLIDTATTDKSLNTVEMEGKSLPFSYK
jgi:hypothetical protein